MIEMLKYYYKFNIVLFQKEGEIYVTYFINFVSCRQSTCEYSCYPLKEDRRGIGMASNSTKDWVLLVPGA